MWDKSKGSSRTLANKKAFGRREFFVVEALEARTLLAATPTLGAIRWDAWFAGNPYQQNLAPAQYQYRLPFYSTGYGTGNVTVVGDSQPVMDQEIEYAKNGGLTYWAFDWYSPAAFTGADNYNYGLRDYLASAHKTDLNFCLLLQGDQLGPAASWSSTADSLVSLMQQPTYQKVLGNRPLIYIYSVNTLATTFGSDAAAKTALNTLRSKAVAAGLGTPYIAAQVWSAADGVTAINNDGLDAISAYAITPAENGAAQEFPHSDLAAANTLFWNQSAATGNDVIPIVTTGWDNRPRWPNHTNGAQPGPYFTTATSADIQTDVTNALTWTSNNAPAAKADTILMYAWNESDEGGWLVPTIADGTARLDAVHQALSLFKPQPRTIALTNGSFEAPKASPWYVVPAGGVDAAFGWQSAAGAGSYLLATAAAGHFTHAANGSQALLLSSAGAVWLDVGTTQANTTYTVNFAVLTGKYKGDTRGTVTVQIFDGSTLLGTRTVTSPATADKWQTYSLSVNTGATVSGDLTIRFISAAGMPWLDNVVLTSRHK